MLDTTSHSGNAKSATSRPPHARWNGYSERRAASSPGAAGEHLGLPHPPGGNAKRYRHFGKQLGNV